MALFPENTLSDYTTKLPRDFALVGSWEVALSEIMYPSTWNNIADGREYYVKVGVPNEADLKMHLKTAYYKYPEDIFFSSPDRWIENLRKDPLRALCLTASILEKLRSTLQCPSSITGLVKNSDDCSELKLVTSINRVVHSRLPGDIHQGLYAIYIYCDLLEYRVVGDTPALYFPSYPWKDNTVILFIDDTKKRITSQCKRKPLTTFILR